MADNYIEKRMQELSSGCARKIANRPSLEALMSYNRSTRKYDTSYQVHELQLRSIVSVNSRIASTRNQQVLRFHLVLRDRASLVMPYVRMAGSTPEPGFEPDAFIIICTSCPDARHYEFDEGIAAQSMLLKAAELKLNGLIIKSFDADKVQEALGMELVPTTVIAIGRSAEKISIEQVGADAESLRIRVEDGVRKVPKIRWEDLIV